ncbi:MAG TPA: Lrp/AsnC family transcriptional regulator [Anaerolineales bacterium]|jgi:Lrp/AsnC family transcriptional regulator for asnA, asnC and gidA
MYKIDNIDLEIVDMLMEDGRMRAAEIARRLGNKSERAVRYRIDRMVENHVIRLSAIVNPKGLGMNVVADVWLEVESDAILEVARKLTSYENVSYVACSIGETDISVQVLAADTTEVYNFVTEVVGKIPGVRKTTTSIVPIVLKDVFQWRIPTSLVAEGTSEE